MKTGDQQDQPAKLAVPGFSYLGFLDWSSGLRGKIRSIHWDTPTPCHIHMANFSHSLSEQLAWKGPLLLHSHPYFSSPPLFFHTWLVRAGGNIMAKD